MSKNSRDRQTPEDLAKKFAAEDKVRGFDAPTPPTTIGRTVVTGMAPPDTFEATPSPLTERLDHLAETFAASDAARSDAETPTPNTEITMPLPTARRAESSSVRVIYKDPGRLGADFSEEPPLEIEGTPIDATGMMDQTVPTEAGNPRELRRARTLAADLEVLVGAANRIAKSDVVSPKDFKAALAEIQEFVEYIENAFTPESRLGEIADLFDSAHLAHQYFTEKLEEFKAEAKRAQVATEPPAAPRKPAVRKKKSVPVPAVNVPKPPEEEPIAAEEAPEDEAADAVPSTSLSLRSTEEFEKPGKPDEDEDLVGDVVEVTENAKFVDARPADARLDVEQPATPDPAPARVATGKKDPFKGIETKTRRGRGYIQRGVAPLERTAGFERLVDPNEKPAVADGMVSGEKPFYIDGTSPEQADARAITPDQSKIATVPILDSREAIPLPVQEKLEPLSTRLSKGLRNMFGGWRPSTEVVTESDLWKVHVRGELSDAERREEGMTKLGVATRATGAVVSGLMSYAGVMLAPDAVRFATQTYYTEQEKTAVKTAIHKARKRMLQEKDPAAIAERERLQNEAALAGKVADLKKEVLTLDTNRVTDGQKAAMLERIEAIMQKYSEASEANDTAFSTEISDLVSNTIRTRISAEKVAKEALNTGFRAASLMSGLIFLEAARAPAYATVSAVERWRKVTREQGTERSASRVKEFVVGGFQKTWSTMRSKDASFTKKAIVGTAALATLARGVAMTSTFVESDAPAMEGAYDLAKASGIGEYMRSLLDAYNAPAVPEVIDVDVIPTEDAGVTVDTGGDTGYDTGVQDSGLDTGVPEVEAPTVEDEMPPTDDEMPPVEAEVPVPDTAGDDSGPDTAAPVDTGSGDVETPTDEAEIVHIPEVSYIQATDGFSQPFARLVKQNLEAYGYTGADDELSIDLFIKQLALKEVNRLGIRDLWLDKSAVGHLAVVPEIVPGAAGTEVHMSFMNIDTNERMTLEEVKKLGWVIPAKG